MQHTSQKNKGFTLIELLVVISIIALLSSIVLASLSTAREKAKESAFIQSMKQVQLALEVYKSENGYYPYENATDFNYLNLDDESMAWTTDQNVTDYNNQSVVNKALIGDYIGSFPDVLTPNEGLAIEYFAGPNMMANFESEGQYNKCDGVPLDEVGYVITLYDPFTNFTLPQLTFFNGFPREDNFCFVEDNLKALGSLSSEEIISSS